MSANDTPLSQKGTNLTNSNPNPKTAKIRALNDILRRRGIGGIYVMTPGVAAQDEFTRVQVLLEIALETDFDDENNPYGEHDFGTVEYEEIIYFWKIDYYDESLEFASKNPSDPLITTRVMTVMLAEEY